MLRLDGNRLTEGAFGASGTFPTGLTELDLSRNPIARLEAAMFGGLDKLTVLRINQHIATVVGINVFREAGVARLVELQMAAAESSGSSCSLVLGDNGVKETKCICALGHGPGTVRSHTGDQAYGCVLPPVAAPAPFVLASPEGDGGRAMASVTFEVSSGEQIGLTAVLLSSDPVTMEKVLLCCTAQHLSVCPPAQLALSCDGITRTVTVALSRGTAHHVLVESVNPAGATLGIATEVVSATLPSHLAAILGGIFTCVFLLMVALMVAMCRQVIVMHLSLDFR